MVFMSMKGFQEARTISALVINHSAIFSGFAPLLNSEFEFFQVYFVVF